MANKKQPSRKSSRVSKAEHSPRPSRSLPLGRVKPDLAAFVWGLSEADIRLVADSISKDLEMLYQMELLERSGFGSN